MRRFSLGDSADRKVVAIETQGTTLIVAQAKADGAGSRREQSFATEAAAKTAAERLIAELSGRGYREIGLATVARSEAGVDPRPAPPSDGRGLFDGLEMVEAETPSLARLAPRPEAAPATPRKKKRGSGKKSKRPRDPDALDRRVLAAIAAVFLLLIGGGAYLFHDAVLRPASVVGVWKGSMVEHEIGRSLTRTSYALTLDAARNASMSIDDAPPRSGTYRAQGTDLFLTLRDEEGRATERRYRFKVDRASLSLIDPESGKLLVDLVRMSREPDSPAVAGAKAAEAARDLVDDGDRTVNPDADRALASVEATAKDGAFRLRHPSGWELQTGGKADNTYSYILLDREPARIAVYADVAGSLISGADSANAADFEEGSPFAPVHKAHEHFAKTGTSELGDYQEGPPEVFRGSGFGEGRISVFTASAGMFGGKLKGYHATVMNRDRRISVLAYGPAQDFPKLRAVYLAVARSLAP